MFRLIRRHRDRPALLMTGALLGAVFAVPAIAASPASAANCGAEITDHFTTVTGAPQVQTYTTHHVTVHNSCADTQRVTIDAERYPDPPCEDVEGGSDHKFTYSVSDDFSEISGAPRGIAGC